MALQGGGKWDVTAIAPRSFRGDLRRIQIEPIEASSRSISDSIEART
jgi:hypothetical protein